MTLIVNGTAGERLIETDVILILFLHFILVILATGCFTCMLIIIMQVNHV